MLILTREKNESIVITTTDGTIEITIAHVTLSGKVQLGIAAPKHIAVYRKEIQLAIERAQAEALEAERNSYGVKSNLPGKTH